MGVSRDSLNCSLNEIEAVAKHATVGAGYTWGLAEESAKAVRWLCMNSLDGCSQLAELLEARLANVSDHKVSNPLEQSWKGVGPLCPLAAGAMLSDHAFRLKSGAATLQDVHSPLFILPFASMLSRQLDSNVTVSCKDSSELRAIAGSESVELGGAFPRGRVSLVLTIGGDISNPMRKSYRAMPEKSVWNRLNRFASLTYAPATDQSRQQGAGAVFSDSD